MFISAVTVHTGLFRPRKNKLRSSRCPLFEGTVICVKILIAYTSQAGAVRDCAQAIASNLKNHSVFLADLYKDAPSVSDFDIIILGASIRMGRIDKKMKKLVAENGEALSQKKVGAFICCGFPERCEEYFRKSFPSDLRASAFALECFGGEIRPDREKGISRWIAKSTVKGITNNNRNPDNEYVPMPAILPENIGRFSDIVKLNCVK